MTNTYTEAVMSTDEQIIAEAKYPIRAAARLTGLSVDTLRAWERRYEAVRPERIGRGRFYTDDDIRRLSLLREVVEKGHAIGQVASLADEQLEELAMAEPAAIDELPARSNLDLGSLYAAITRYDAAAVDRDLARYAALLSPRDLIHHIVQPMLQWIGHQWEVGNLSIAQEHVASTSLRNLLGTLARIYAPTRAVRSILFATPTGERHEFGILSAAMLAAGGGLGTVYLGVDVPAEEIVRAAKATSVDAVVLGVVVPTDEAMTIDSVRRVREGLPDGVELYAGGCPPRECGDALEAAGARYLESFGDLERELQRLGARF